MAQADIHSMYKALVDSSLTFAGVDQGIDFTGPGNIHALDNGIVERVQTGGSGWPGQGALLTYKLTSGPYTGQHVYVAEDFNPRVKAGATVRKGQVLGVATGSGRAPGIEVGWADASGSPIAPLNPNPHAPKPEGADFDNVVHVLSGAPGRGTPGGAPIGRGGPTPAETQAIQGQSSDVASGVTSAAKAIASPFTSLVDFYNFVTSWRFAEVVGGFFLLIVGLYLLGRQFGAVPSVVQTAAAVTPAGRVAAYADKQAPAKRESLRPQPVYGKTRGRDTYGEVPF